MTDSRAATETQITGMLQAINSSNGEKTVERVFVALRSAIREAASRQMESFSGEDLLDATSLTHEAYLRVNAWVHRYCEGLADSEGPERTPSEPHWKNRQHFTAEMVVLMRRLLIDSAKRRGSLKRGGGATHSIANEESLTIHSEPADTLLIADALEALRRREPKAADLADLHVFGGLTWESAGEVMGIPERERRGLISVIKAFLSREING